MVGEAGMSRHLLLPEMEQPDSSQRERYRNLSHLSHLRHPFMPVALSALHHVGHHPMLIGRGTLLTCPHLPA
jgi:hypothetical protein